MWKAMTVKEFFDSEKENGFHITANGDLFGGGFFYESGIASTGFIRAEITREGENYFIWKDSTEGVHS